MTQTRELFAAVLDHFGRLDTVVSNLGGSVFQPTTEIEEDDMVAFLASDDARRGNGQTLQVNGGIL